MQRFVQLSGLNLRNTTFILQPTFYASFPSAFIFLPMTFFPRFFWQLASENIPQLHTKPHSQDAGANKNKAARKKIGKRFEETK